MKEILKIYFNKIYLYWISIFLLFIIICFFMKNYEIIGNFLIIPYIINLLFVIYTYKNFNLQKTNYSNISFLFLIILINLLFGHNAGTGILVLISYLIYSIIFYILYLLKNKKFVLYVLKILFLFYSFFMLFNFYFCIGYYFRLFDFN